MRRGKNQKLLKISVTDNTHTFRKTQNRLEKKGGNSNGTLYR